MLVATCSLGSRSWHEHAFQLSSVLKAELITANRTMTLHVALLLSLDICMTSLTIQVPMRCKTCTASHLFPSLCVLLLHDRSLQTHRYWAFPGNNAHIYVEMRPPLTSPTAAVTATSAQNDHASDTDSNNGNDSINGQNGVTSDSGDAEGASRSVADTEKAVTGGEDSGKEVGAAVGLNEEAKWAHISQQSELLALVDSLDTRGVREVCLNSLLAF